MGMIRRTVHVRHDKGHLLGGLLHYASAASNRASRGYRRGVRGKDLYHMAVHRTDVYQSRFADYIVREICGSHRAWRTNQLADPHARAPHYHNATAQTDRFAMAFDDASKRWDGSPAIHVAIYGRGKPGRLKQPWMAFHVPPYVVKRLTEPGVTPKTVRLDRDEIYVTYEKHVPDREHASWAGIDMNAGNNTYAYPNGMVGVVWNYYAKEYNAACSKVLRVRRRGDARIMAKYTEKAWGTYHNRVGDHMGKEAKALALAGCGVGYEDLNIHRMYTKDGRTEPLVRGRLKTTLNVGRRRRAISNAQEAAGLPHTGVDPSGTSAKCLACGKKLKRAVVQQKGARNMWCQPCRAIRERDGNGSANILFRTIVALVVEYTGNTGSARGTTLPHIVAMLRGALADPRILGNHRSTSSNVLRLLEGRSAGADWRLPGAHKPGRRNPAGGEPVGGPGVDGAGRNGPGPTNAAKPCVGDYA